MSADQVRRFLTRLIRRVNLTREDAAQLLEILADDDVSEAAIAATLTALTTKGETVAELAGMASALRNLAVRIRCNHPRLIDTAGTGSSTAKTFNVSSAAAFVIAGAGYPVAKHGNRAASSRSGSADVMAALGININATPTVSERCLAEIGICFMFAPLYHGATARVAAVRRELGVHTTFNLLGPLSNPAGAPYQVVGVWRRDLVELLANALALLGTERAWVVHGEDGLDEITLGGRTFVAETRGTAVSTFEIGPKDFGLEKCSLEHLRGGDANANARIINQVLSGERRDEARRIVVANAAAALHVAGAADNLRDATQMAEMSIDSGAAKAKLVNLISATNDGIA